LTKASNRLNAEAFRLETLFFVPSKDRKSLTT